MADQGALGRQHAYVTGSSYLPALKHYTRLGARGERWGYSGVAGMRDIYKNTAALRAALHVTAYSDGAVPWQDLYAGRRVLTMLPLSDTVLLDVAVGYSTPKRTHRRDGYIQGTLKEATVPVANAYVILLWRDPPTQIAWTMTDANGVYRFDGLDSTQAMYCVLHLDLPGGTQWNAQRLDWMTPTAY